jgi:hypothetical protein
VSTEYDVAKSTNDSPANAQAIALSSRPTTFIDDLYYLLFRNQKAEATIYVVSLGIALAYAIIRHFTFATPQRTVLTEGSFVALGTFIILTLTYIVSVRNRGIVNYFLMDVWAVTRHLALNAALAVSAVLVIGLITFLTERITNQDDKLFGKIPIDWIRDVAYLAITGKFLWASLTDIKEEESDSNKHSGKAKRTKSRD